MDSKYICIISIASTNTPNLCRELSFLQDSLLAVLVRGARREGDDKQYGAVFLYSFNEITGKWEKAKEIWASDNSSRSLYSMATGTNLVVVGSFFGEVIAFQLSGLEVISETIISKPIGSSGNFGWSLSISKFFFVSLTQSNTFYCSW